MAGIRDVSQIAEFKNRVPSHVSMNPFHLFTKKDFSFRFRKLKNRFNGLTGDSSCVWSRVRVIFNSDKMAFLSVHSRIMCTR